MDSSLHSTGLMTPIKNARGLNLALRRCANRLKVRLTDFSITSPVQRGKRVLRGIVSFNVDSAYWGSAVPNEEAVNQLAAVVKRANFRWTSPSTPVSP